jgi:hypothetical protein
VGFQIVVTCFYFLIFARVAEKLINYVLKIKNINIIKIYSNKKDNREKVHSWFFDIHFSGIK